MTRIDELESFHPKNRGEWLKWLQTNHLSSTGVWLVVSKKSSVKPGVNYDEAVEEALSHGSIDGRARAHDGQAYVLLLTPRKPGSVWAKSNRLRVEKLIDQGLMTATGLAKVEAAKKDGSWNRLDDIEQLKLPADFKRALAADKAAKKNYEAFPDSSKKMILAWILDARRAGTMSKRIEETVALAARNTRAR